MSEAFPAYLEAWLVSEELPLVNEPGLEHLFHAFTKAEIPRRLWHHRAHLLVAIAVLSRMSEEDGLAYLRRGIQRYNRIHGIENGYHETLTRFWSAMVAGALRVLKCMSTQEKTFAMLQAFHKDLPLSYYSPSLLSSDFARTDWCLPNKKPLMNKDIFKINFKPDLANCKRPVAT